jgi:hypothetical protein
MQPTLARAYIIKMRIKLRYKKHWICLSKKTNKYYIVNGSFEHKSLRRVKAEIDFKVYGIGNIVNNRVSNSPHYNKKIYKQLNDHKILFDIKIPEYSYLIGFIQSDGNLIRAKNRKDKWKMSIELGIKDITILKKIKKLILPTNSSISTRIRDTNFKKNNKSATLYVCDKHFRYTINYYGVPYGKKSNIIEVPKQKYSEADYWRGIIDGDGSIGFTKDKKPFISLVTSSSKLVKSYCDFIYKNTGKIFNKKDNRNKRDNVYNIIIVNEDAKKIISLLYYKGCISINRKYVLSKKIIKWKRPINSNKRQVIFNDWTKDDIEILIKNSINDCVLKFKNKRSLNSIKLKRARERRKLKNKGIKIINFKNQKHN